MEVSSRKNIQLKKAFSPSQATLEHMNDGLYKGPNRHTIGRGVANWQHYAHPWLDAKSGRQPNRWLLKGLTFRYRTPNPPGFLVFGLTGKL